MKNFLKYWLIYFLALPVLVYGIATVMGLLFSFGNWDIQELYDMWQFEILVKDGDPFIGHRLLLLFWFLVSAMVSITYKFEGPINKM